MHIDQICGHLWANGFAGSEEKIGDINGAFIIFLGNRFAVLVGKRKIGNVVFVGNILYGRVHQFRVYIGWVVNGERFFGFQCGIKQGNHDDGKHQPDANEFSIFMEKGFHENNLGKNTERRFVLN